MPLTREDLLVVVEENPEALFELLASHIPEAQFQRDEHMRQMTFGVPVPFFNGMAMARLTVDNCDAMIERAITELNATGMPWSWQVGPGSTPYDLSERLNNHGLKHSHDMPIMVADVRQWQAKPWPANYQTVAVNDIDTYDRWIEVAEIAFGLPRMVFDVMRRAQLAIGFANDAPVRNFLGVADGEPVSSATVFYSHGVGGIFTVGTPPQYRGRGYGNAVTESCMADIRERGVDTAFLQSSNMGYRVYERIGFQEICKISIFVPNDD